MILPIEETDPRWRVELHLIRRYGLGRYLRVAWDIAVFFHRLRRDVRKGTAG